MTKIVFCFAGTGDPGDKYAQATDNQSHFNDDVVRVYFRGSHHNKIGNSYFYPDLGSVATRIRNAFEGNQVDLAQLKREFGDGICLIKGPADLTAKVPVESIGLQGFSRGGVTTFATAKKLDDLGIPLDIIANQPVPGQSAIDNTAFSIYSQFNDLTQCKNIRSATTLLASHSLDNGFYHNHFLQQMIAKFSSNVNVNNWLMPHQYHLDWLNSSLIPIHINREFSKMGYATKKYGSFHIHLEYSNNVYFTPEEFSQPIFGQDDSIKKDPIYLKAVQHEACLSYFLNVGSVPYNLSDNEASAIMAISQLNFDKECTQKLMSFVLERKAESERYIEIVNKVHGLCEYLTSSTDDYENHHKSAQIKEHSVSYKKTIFVQSYHYMSKTDHSKDQQHAFFKEIKNAERIFEENATSIDRGIMRVAMKVIVNTILHVTGLFLIANTLNAALTRDYFFFNNTRSTKMVIDTSNKVLDLLNAKDPGKSTAMKDNDKMIPEKDAETDYETHDNKPEFK